MPAAAALYADTFCAHAAFKSLLTARMMHGALLHGRTARIRQQLSVLRPPAHARLQGSLQPDTVYTRFAAMVHCSCPLLTQNNMQEGTKVLDWYMTQLAMLLRPAHGKLVVG
jgi:hypothetical protein